MMRLLRALFGVRYFNIHAEGTFEDGDKMITDVGNLPEKHLDAVLGIIMEWDLKDVWVKVDEA